MNERIKVSIKFQEQLQSFLNGYGSLDGRLELNTHFSQKVSDKNFEIYIGGENLTNYKQENPILASDNPFGANFDSSIVYAPILGSTYYAGLRFTIN